MKKLLAAFCNFKKMMGIISFVYVMQTSNNVRFLMKFN